MNPLPIIWKWMKFMISLPKSIRHLRKENSDLLDQQVEDRNEIRNLRTKVSSLEETIKQIRQLKFDLSQYHEVKLSQFMSIVVPLGEDDPLNSNKQYCPFCFEQGCFSRLRVFDFPEIKGQHRHYRDFMCISCKQTQRLYLYQLIK